MVEFWILVYRRVHAVRRQWNGVFIVSCRVGGGSGGGAEHLGTLDFRLSLDVVGKGLV